MRLIDADALIEDLVAAKENGGMGSVVAETLIRYVKRCDTVDAEKVKHGKWDEIQLTRRTKSYKCSVCGHWEDVKCKYCNCGAKMDL